MFNKHQFQFFRGLVATQQETTRQRSRKSPPTEVEWIYLAQWTPVIWYRTNQLFKKIIKQWERETDRIPIIIPIYLLRKIEEKVDEGAERRVIFDGTKIFKN